MQRPALTTKVVTKINGKNARCIVTQSTQLPERLTLVHCVDDGHNYIIETWRLTEMDWSKQ